MMGCRSAMSNKIASNPPVDGKKIVNIYVDKNGKVVIEYET